MIPLRIFLAFAIAWHSLCCLPMSAEPTQLAADELAREKEIITLLHAGDFKQGEKSLRDHLKSGSNYWDLYTLGLVLLDLEFVSRQDFNVGIQSLGQPLKGRSFACENGFGLFSVRHLDGSREVASRKDAFESVHSKGRFRHFNGKLLA